MSKSVEFDNLTPKKRFVSLDECTKQELLENRKAQNTNRATKQWVSCLNEFLKEKDKPDLDAIDVNELPDIMGDFYFSVRKKRISEKGVDPNATESSKSKLSHYKNSSLKSGRAAINRHIKAKLI